MSPVKLKDVAEHMDMSMDGMGFYLHRKTGELELVEGDVLTQILDGETPEPMYGPKEWLKTRAASPPRWTTMSSCPSRTVATAIG